MRPLRQFDLGKLLSQAHLSGGFALRGGGEIDIVDFCHCSASKIQPKGRVLAFERRHASHRPCSRNTMFTGLSRKTKIGKRWSTVYLPNNWGGRIPIRLAALRSLDLGEFICQAHLSSNPYLPGSIGDRLYLRKLRLHPLRFVSKARWYVCRFGGGKLPAAGANSHGQGRHGRCLACGCYGAPAMASPRPRSKFRGARFKDGGHLFSRHVNDPSYPRSFGVILRRNPSRQYRQNR